jgi:hypothetical protein
MVERNDITPPPARTARWRAWWWLLPALLLLAAASWRFEFTAYQGRAPEFRAAPLDDAWVHFVYARNALRTGILHYNPGEPAAGTTSLLWVLLLALPLRLGVYAPLAAKALGLLALLGLATGLFVLLKRWGSLPLAVIGALLVLVDPLNIFAALSGMEVALYAALALGAATALVAEKPRLAGVLAAATVIVRPDGSLLAALVIVGGLLQALLGLRRDRPGGAHALAQNAFWLVLPPLLAGLFWAWLDWRATGRLAPASFYVRAGGWSALTSGPTLRGLLAEINRLGGFVGHPLQWMLYALGLLWIAWRRDARWLPFVVFPWALALLLGSEKLQLIGGTFPGNRYLVPALPFLFAVELLGAAFVTDLLLEKRVLHRTYRRHLPLAVALAALALLLADAPDVLRAWRDQPREFARGCADIERMQVRMGEWVNANTPPDATIGLFDAGAIAYFGRRQMVDILGLNTPHLAPLSPRVIEKLDYLITYPDVSQGVERPYADRVIFRIDLPDSNTNAGKSMVVYQVRAPARP